MEARRSCRCCLGNPVSRVEELPCEWMHSSRPLLLHHLLGIHEGAELIIPPDLGWDGFLARVLQHRMVFPGALTPNPV